MTRDECRYFLPEGAVVSVTPKLKRAVHYMDACSFQDFQTEQTFDVVFILNTLVYVPEDKQSTTIDQVAKYNSGILVTSAFHMDTIKDDLSRNQYHPVLDNQIEIHDSWSDRRVAEYSEQLADGIFANWRLPEFSEVEDFEYKYCAIFRKEDFGGR